MKTEYSNYFDNKVAIITGATGDIGLAITKKFHDLGIKLLLTGKNEEKTNNLSKNMVNDTYTISIDLSLPGAETKIIKSTIDKFGKIDILINNAAIIHGGLFIKTSDEMLRKTFEINFFKPYKLMQNVLPYMLKNKFGRIINITSLAGEIGDAGMSAYSASKAALAAASKSIAAEYGKRGITVNCIAPGLIETKALKTINPAYLNLIKTQIPSRRFGTPEEIASLATYLASEKSAYINGQIININGGLYR